MRSDGRSVEKKQNTKRNGRKRELNVCQRNSSHTGTGGCRGGTSPDSRAAFNSTHEPGWSVG